MGHVKSEATLLADRQAMKVRVYGFILIINGSDKIVTYLIIAM